MQNFCESLDQIARNLDRVAAALEPHESRQQECDGNEAELAAYRAKVLGHCLAVKVLLHNAMQSIQSTDGAEASAKIMRAVDILKGIS